MGCFGYRRKYVRVFHECFNLKCPNTDECDKETEKNIKNKYKKKTGDLNG